MRDFKPGDKIEVLINPSSKEAPIWEPAEIDDTLSTQVTYKFEGATEFAIGFLSKSDFGITWRSA